MTRQALRCSDGENALCFPHGCAEISSPSIAITMTLGNKRRDDGSLTVSCALTEAPTLSFRDSARRRVYRRRTSAASWPWARCASLRRPILQDGRARERLIPVSMTRDRAAAPPRYPICTPTQATNVTSAVDHVPPTSAMTIRIRVAGMRIRKRKNIPRTQPAIRLPMPTATRSIVASRGQLPPR
jgi:hypothetical protein